MMAGASLSARRRNYPGTNASGRLLVKWTPGSAIMVQTEYLRNHIDELLRLSHDVKEPAVSAKLREMADECRIMLSVGDICEQAADLNRSRTPIRN
jgi:hypothetical protein